MVFIAPSMYLLGPTTLLMVEKIAMVGYGLTLEMFTSNLPACPFDVVAPHARASTAPRKSAQPDSPAQIERVNQLPKTLFLGPACFNSCLV